VRTIRDHRRDRRLEAQLHPCLAGDREELVAVLGEQLLVRRHDGRPARIASRTKSRRVDPSDQLDDHVGALEDRTEVPFGAGEDA